MSTKTKKIVKPVAQIQPGTQLTMKVTEQKPVIASATVDANKIIRLDNLETLGILKSFDGLQDALVTNVKNGLLAGGAKKCESANFDGQISGGGNPDVIVPAKFFALCAKKGIKQTQINEVISVAKGKIKFLSEDEITNICEPGEYREPSLNVTRKKMAAPLKVRDAINVISAEANAGHFPDIMPAKTKKNGKE